MNNVAFEHFGAPPPPPHPHPHPHPHHGPRPHGPGGWYPSPIIYGGGYQPYIAPYPIDCNEVLRYCLPLVTPVIEKPPVTLAPLDGMGEGGSNAGAVAAFGLGALFGFAILPSLVKKHR